MRASTDTRGSVTDRLQELVQLNLDCDRAFRRAGDSVQQPEMTSLLYELARQRKQFAEQLKQHVPWHGIEVSRHTGGPLASMHRWWHELKSRLRDGEPHALLNTLACSERDVEEAYDRMIELIRDQPVHELLVEQKRQLQAGHARLDRARRRSRARRSA